MSLLLIWPSVIGTLRLVGLLNAAVWFGATLFFAVGAQPAATSTEMKQLIGPDNFSYFSVVIGQIIGKTFFHLYLACSAVAVLHLVAEWLYFGRYPHRAWLVLVLGLCLGGLFQAYLVQPRLREFHQLRFRQPAMRESAVRAFAVWRGISLGVNAVLVGALGVYVWRIANPREPMRFVSASKFRS